MAAALAGGIYDCHTHMRAHTRTHTHAHSIN